MRALFFPPKDIEFLDLRKSGAQTGIAGYVAAAVSDEHDRHSGLLSINRYTHGNYKRVGYSLSYLKQGWRAANIDMRNEETKFVTVGGEEGIFHATGMFIVDHQLGYSPTHYTLKPASADDTNFESFARAEQEYAESVKNNRDEFYAKYAQIEDIPVSGSK